MGNRPGKRERAPIVFGYGIGSRGAFIREDLRTSKAWKSLTPTAKLVLLDMLTQYFTLSQGGRDSLKQRGFSYTYAHCKEDLAPNSFHTARTMLVDRGFFATPKELQPQTPGMAMMFAPSDNWTQYQPKTKTENKRLTREETKKKFLAKENDRRKTYLEEKKDSANFGSVPPQKLRDLATAKSRTPPKNCVAVNPISPLDPPQKLGGSSSIAIPPPSEFADSGAKIGDLRCQSKSRPKVAASGGQRQTSQLRKAWAMGSKKAAAPNLPKSKPVPIPDDLQAQLLSLEAAFKDKSISEAEAARIEAETARMDRAQRRAADRRSPA